MYIFRVFECIATSCNISIISYVFDVFVCMIYGPAQSYRTDHACCPVHFLTFSRYCPNIPWSTTGILVLTYCILTLPTWNGCRFKLQYCNDYGSPIFIFLLGWLNITLSHVPFSQTCVPAIMLSSYQRPLSFTLHVEVSLIHCLCYTDK